LELSGPRNKPLEDLYGKDFHENKAGQDAEIRRQVPQPLQALRAAARVSQEIRRLQIMLPATGL